MVAPLIIAERLNKSYRVPERAAGLLPAVKSLWRRRYRLVDAVCDVCFRIEAGEMVALLGPNGAGKTTTLKLLAGLLFPSAGTVQVAGYVPWQRKPPYLQQIGMVTGNKNQLSWDIPALDSFRVLAEIYRVPPAAFHQTLDELVALLQMEPLLSRPLRNLSLGERMKCELVASLLHQPAVLFLDEPTLGLDVSMQRRLRQFIADYNGRYGVTVLLSSHYMADVAALCKRVLLIHRGRLLYDGDLQQLAQRLTPSKFIRLTLTGRAPALSVPALAQDGVEVVTQTDEQIVLRVARHKTAAVTAHVLQTMPVLDLSVEEMPLDAVIDQIYERGDV